MLAKLQNIFQEPQYIDKDLVEDVEIELKQAHNTVNIYSDILTGTMDAFASIISNNVNTIMKRMTSLSIILMVPTLIASFYGMNVPIYMEDMPHGFVVHLALDLAIRYGLFYIQEDQMVLGYQINKPDADHPCLSVSSASGKYQIRYIFILAYLCVSSRI